MNSLQKLPIGIFSRSKTALSERKSHSVYAKLLCKDIVLDQEIAEAYRDELGWYNACIACRDYYAELIHAYETESIAGQDFEIEFKDNIITINKPASNELIQEDIESKDIVTKYYAWINEISKSAKKLRDISRFLPIKYRPYLEGGEVNDCIQFDIDDNIIKARLQALAMQREIAAEKNPTSREANPDIYTGHLRKGLYEPKFYQKQCPNGIMWIPNIRILMNPGNPKQVLGVAKNWEPKQVKATYIAYKKVPDYTKPVKKLFKSVKYTYVTRHGKRYRAAYVLGINERVTYPSKFVVNEHGVKVGTKAEYLKEAGIPFLGSNQLYAPKGFAYNEKYCVSTEIASWAYFLQKRFLNHLFFGNITVTSAIEYIKGKRKYKRQAYKIMNLRYSSGGRTIKKDVVVFCDIK